MNRIAAVVEAHKDGLSRSILAVSMVAALAVILCTAVAAQERAGDAERRGRELAKRVLQAQDTSGFQIRARVVVGDDSNEALQPAILQVRIVGRRENNATRILYQILWPTALKGQAAVIERRQNPPAAGFLFEPPDRVARLSPVLFATPFAGTGLTFEDLAEDFWRWPLQQVTGQGRGGEDACTILESRPSSEIVTAYSLVRSCVAPKKATPLWIEKFGADGRRAKRMSFEAPARKSRDQDSRLVMIVDNGTASQRTRVEFLKSERGITVSPDEFSVERLKRLGGKPPMDSVPERWSAMHGVALFPSWQSEGV